MHHHIVRLGSQAASCDHKILRKARKNIARIDRGGHTESKATQNATLLRGRHASGTRQAVGNLPPAGDNRMQYRPHEYGRYSAGPFLVLLAYTRFVRTEHARMTAASAIISEVDAEIDALKVEIAATGVGTGSPS